MFVYLLIAVNVTKRIEAVRAMKRKSTKRGVGGEESIQDLAFIIFFLINLIIANRSIK